MEKTNAEKITLREWIRSKFNEAERKMMAEEISEEYYNGMISILNTLALDKRNIKEMVSYDLLDTYVRINSTFIVKEVARDPSKSYKLEYLISLIRRLEV